MMPSNPSLSRCIVFAGGLKASPLQAACPISVLNLPLLPRSEILDHVLSRIAEVAPAGGPVLPVTIVYGEPVPAPTLVDVPNGLTVAVVAEPGRWRGPAGVLLDLCEDLPSEANILVLEGARWYAAGFADLATDHHRRGADVTIAQSADRTPAGAYLIRRAALDQVPRAGFLDLKEQLLTRLLGERKRLVVHTLPPPGSMPVRTLADLLSAARAAAGGPAGWSLIHLTADIDPAAVVVSSIIAAKCRIGPGAVVARSVVLEGATVAPSAEVVDAIVLAGRASPRQPAARAGRGEPA